MTNIEQAKKVIGEYLDRQAYESNVTIDEAVLSDHLNKANITDYIINNMSLVNSEDGKSVDMAVEFTIDNRTFTVTLKRTEVDFEQSS